MKKKHTIVAFSVAVFLAISGTSVMNAEGSGDADAIMQKMMKLGFLQNRIDKQKDGSYSIGVNSYTPKSKALSLKGVFRPFEVRAKFIRRTLYLDKSDLEKAGFVVYEEHLPSGIKIMRTGYASIASQTQKSIKDPMKDPNFERVKLALIKTKRNSARVFANSRAVKHKASQGITIAFPDVAMSPPSPPGGPIPIPYPNIAMAGDTTKGPKKVKINADKAEALLKDSYFKRSESDEIGHKVEEITRLIRVGSKKGTLSDRDRVLYRDKLIMYHKQAAFIARALDKYVEEIEKLLEDSKKELGIK